jgi:hypothetical protein
MSNVSVWVAAQALATSPLPAKNAGNGAPEASAVNEICRGVYEEDREEDVTDCEAVGGLV